MTDPVQEQLSACLDGALPEAELGLLVKRVERDAGLASTLGRYALIGEVLKADKPVAASPKFAANVMAALADEPAARRATGLSPALARRLRPVAGFAVAAGVAAMAVFTVQQIGGNGAEQQIAATTAPTTTAASDQGEELAYVVPTTTTTTALVPATRLTNYVVAHSEYSSPLGRRSVLSGVLAEDDMDDQAEAAADAAAAKMDDGADGESPQR